MFFDPHQPSLHQNFHNQIFLNAFARFGPRFARLRQNFAGVKKCAASFLTSLFSSEVLSVPPG
jgi:hypothetical protein